MLDIMLPGRDGLSILATLREARNTVPVVLLTGREFVLLEFLLSGLRHAHHTQSLRVTSPHPLPESTISKIMFKHVAGLLTRHSAGFVPHADA